ncbi:hypothetical protein LCGC14_0373120 [marine sediment metagenome]|uniref:Uncharacterized protein n=1 Tax=marine sediment metagenome TaxID=412755 RepID=A0A0F9TME9_9ZZZZ
MPIDPYVTELIEMIEGSLSDITEALRWIVVVLIIIAVSVIVAGVK